MIVTIFRSRLRPENEAAYHAEADRIYALAQTMPGFVSLKTFHADDGERVSIVEFESKETMRVWREHPEHRKAQALGRELFYSEYQIQVCPVVRQYGFTRPGE
jgi:heme-degrading monooxygenase HmoA